MLDLGPNGMVGKLKWRRSSRALRPVWLLCSCPGERCVELSDVTLTRSSKRRRECLSSLVVMSEP
jgi:hypothetical protein